MSRRLRTKLLISICAAVAISLANAAWAAADTYTVNVTSEFGDFSIGDGICDASVEPETECSLRAAIEEANFTPDSTDDVDFTAGLGAINLTSPISITAPVTIDGNGSSGPDGTVVDGGDLTQLFSVSSAADPLTTFRDMRLEDGSVVGDGGGAAIRTDASTTLDNVAVTSSSISGLTSNGHGAGVFNSNGAATLSVEGSAITANTITNTRGIGARGAGIASAGPLSLTDTTVSGNAIGDGGGSSAQGGGIWADGGLVLLRSTVSGNSVAGLGAEGGGIFNGRNPGTRSILNSTISGNAAPESGAGGVQLGADAAITHTTLAANNGGKGGVGADLTAYAGTVTAKSTIFGSTTGCAAIVGGSIASATPGNNIDTGSSCDFGTANGNQENTDPKLGPLALNAPGGTQTHALLLGSPALDAATLDCGGLIVDQRGFARSQGGPICDVGSYEAQHRLLTATRSGAGTGSVTATGISCGGDCSQSYVEGTSVVLTAIPAAGSDFAAWSGCDSTAGNQCTVTLASDRMVAAGFSLTPVEPPPPFEGGATPTPPSTKKCRKGFKRVKGKCKRKRKQGL